MTGKLVFDKFGKVMILGQKGECPTQKPWIDFPGFSHAFDKQSPLRRFRQNQKIEQQAHSIQQLIWIEVLFCVQIAKIVHPTKPAGKSFVKSVWIINFFEKLLN